MASDEMSFENVDDDNDNGQQMPGCDLWAFDSGELKINSSEAI